VVSTILNLLIVACTAVLSMRLYSSRLSRRYRAFFSYLIFCVVQIGLLAAFNVRSGWYQKVYILSEPLSWILCAWVVIELYSLVLDDYRGLSTVGRWTLMVAMAVALMASAASFLVPSRGPGQSSRLLPYYYATERAVYFSLVVFLLAILFVLLHYPITLRRNIIVHSIVYSVYFLSNTVIYVVLSTLGYGTVQTVDYALQAVTLASLGAWLVLLNPAGEQRKARLRPDWMPGQEAELVQQLASLNDMLLRVARK
jgi:hypothetical protein